MRTPPTNICPLLMISGIGSFERPPAVCLEDGCAWWDHLAGGCCMASGADYLRAVSDSLEALERKKAPASAANAGRSRVEQTLTGPDSILHYT